MLAYVFGHELDMSTDVSFAGQLDFRFDNLLMTSLFQDDISKQAGLSLPSMKLRL